MIADADQPAPGSVAIAVAPNGGRKSRQDHPQLPLTAAELARTAAESRDAGAAMMHFHIRDADGRHLLDGDAYRRATRVIRREVGPGLLLQITSEALGRYAIAEQVAVVRAVRPEAVSLALREFAPTAAEEAGFARFLRWMKQEAIIPQIIVYSAAEAQRLGEFRRRGMIPWDHPPVLLVVGRPDAHASGPTDLLAFLPPTGPAFRHWMTCVFGRQETAVSTAAALLGGGIRLGFENNLWRPSGTRLTSNAAQVASLARILRQVGLAPLSGPELRARWSAL